MENKEIRARLIGMIESGLYPHCRDVLSDKLNGIQRFCINGLLCEIHRQVHGGEWIFIPETPYGIGTKLKEIGRYEYLGEGFVLPPAVRDWSGIVTHSIRCSEPGKSHGGILSRINDRATSWTPVLELLKDNNRRMY